MGERNAPKGTHGFSLVEMMVALAFILILMAGMATVFKTSLSTTFTSGEVLSSARRNRMSIDVLANDIDTAELYLQDLSAPPQVQGANPPFYILPNMPIAGAGPNDPQTSDQLFFYVDQPLGFPANLGAAPAAQSASQMVASGAATTTAANNTYVITCPNQTYANMVQPGQIFLFMDSWEAGYIQAAPLVGTPTGAMGNTTVTVVAAANPMAAVTGSGSSGLPSRNSHIGGCGILFVQPAQMVRYSVQMVQLDPNNANGVPCLVRDQGAYGGAFVATAAPQIITENLGQGGDAAKSGFKVYLSVDSGQDWEGLGSAATGFTAGWDQGIRTQLDNQLAITGRPGFQTTRGSDHWFRNIPTLVRVDLTTRTAVQRTEYNTTTAPNAQGYVAPSYTNFTQTLVFVPALSGLPFN